VAYDNFPEAMAAMGELSKEGMQEDLVSASEFLKAAGFTSASTAVVGYCMGGSVAFFAATLGVVGAAASFYGGGVETGRFGLPSLLELAPDLKSAWIGLYGDLDKGIPSAEVEQLREAAAGVTVPTEIVRYPDADHGFNCNDRPAVFNPTAAADAWGRTLDWFDRYLT
jgi:carboxymethylenebutenolidase